MYLRATRGKQVLNPPPVEALVDPSKWPVAKTEFHYPWGDMLLPLRTLRSPLPTGVLAVRAPTLFLSAANQAPRLSVQRCHTGELFVTKWLLHVCSQQLDPVAVEDESIDEQGDGVL